MRWHVHSRVKDTSVTGSPDHGISLPLQALRAWRGVAWRAEPSRGEPGQTRGMNMFCGAALQVRPGQGTGGPGRAGPGRYIEQGTSRIGFPWQRKDRLCRGSSFRGTDRERTHGEGEKKIVYLVYGQPLPFTKNKAASAFLTAQATYQEVFTAGRGWGRGRAASMTGVDQ